MDKLNSYMAFARSIRQRVLNLQGEIHRLGFLFLTKPSLYTILSNNSITNTVYQLERKSSIGDAGKFNSNEDEATFHI